MIEVLRVWGCDVAGVCEARRDLLEKAAEATFSETPESLVDLAETGDITCWAAFEDEVIRGLLFTQILDSAKQRTLIVIAFAGEGGMRWIKQAREVIRDHARRNGVNVMSAIRINGKRTLLGMKPSGMYYEERL